MSFSCQILFVIGLLFPSGQGRAFQVPGDTLSSKKIYQQAKAYQNSAVYDSALYFFELLEKRSQASEDWKGVVMAYIGIGGIRIDQGKYDEAERLLKKSLQLSDLRLDSPPPLQGGSFFHISLFV